MSFVIFLYQNKSDKNVSKISWYDKNKKIN